MRRRAQSVMRTSVMTFVANVGQCASGFARFAQVFTYDADGNMTSDGRFAYTWNAENRMVMASNAEVVVTDGTIVAHYDYSPFGEQLITSGPLAVTFTHRFSTKPWCSASGLVEYQMRKYCPDIGRWMSRDPIGEGGGLDIYSFVLNSSVNNEDTLGKNARVRLGDRFPNYHVQICVDIYDQNGSKSGENCYGFTPIPLGIWETATWRFGCPCKGYAGVEDAILGKIVEINYGSTCSPEVERRLDAIVKEVIESETGTQTYLKWSFNCNDWLLRVTDRLAAKLKELEKALEACNTPLPNIP